MGPLVGQWIYGVLSFQWTFYTFAGILTPFMILVIFMIPKVLNYNEQVKLLEFKEKIDKNSFHEEKVVTYV